MTSLKQKAISGASWSLAGRILQQGTTFFIGIILARLLTPEQYGLVGMATVFIFVSYVFVDSGFSSAIIQKKKCTDTDLSTVFYINLGISIITYLIFFLTAPAIAHFFNENELIRLIRILSLIILLYALSIVQNSIIQREVNFKLKTQIEFISQLISGIIAIFLALKGFGVWALVWKTLLNQVFINVQLWIRNNWIPKLVFSKESFITMFSFGYKILLSGILDRGYSQIYKLIIGKFFPVRELGLYTRAEQFSNLPSMTISGALLGFTLPVFSEMQDNPAKLKRAVKKTISIIMYFNLVAMVFLAVIAEPLISVLLGQKWMDAVPYLQLLIIVGLFYPMHLINLQILTALGRSNLFLKIEVFKKILNIPAILLGIFVSIKAMIIGIALTSLFTLFVNTYYTKRLINLSFWEQFKSISKSLILSLGMGTILFTVSFIIKNHISEIVMLILQSMLGLSIFLILSRIMNMEEYKEIRGILKAQLVKFSGSKI